MQIVKFMLTTLATLLVRSVFNMAHLIVTAAFAAVVYYLYPQVEAVYVAAGLTTGINLLINSIHMGWEAYWLYAEVTDAEKKYAYACKIDAHKGWSESSWTEAEEAYNLAYGRMVMMTTNWLCKSQRNFLENQMNEMNNTRRACTQARVDAREYARKMTANR